MTHYYQIEKEKLESLIEKAKLGIGNAFSTNNEPSDYNTISYYNGQKFVLEYLKLSSEIVSSPVEKEAVESGCGGVCGVV